MGVTSFAYVLLVAGVCAVYWSVADRRIQNALLVERLAYGRKAVTGQRRLLQSWPLYQRRDAIRASLERAVKGRIGRRIANVDAKEVDSAILRLFADEKLDKGRLTQVQLGAESQQDEDDYNFGVAVDRSFLPAIVELASQHKVNLTMVRMKRRRDLAPGHEPDALVQYMADLGAYLRTKDIPLIDFTHDDRITLDHYGAGDHLNKTSGRKRFTELMAGELCGLLSRK